MENPSQNLEKEGPKKNEVKNDDSFFSWKTAFFIIAVFVVVLPIRIFIAKPFIVSGASMDPTFATWHYLIIDQISYRLHEPKRGDVIVFRFPQDTSRFFIKRIIGLPNETLFLDDTSVRIANEKNPNGFILDEPYIAEKNNKSFTMTIRLGDDEYFVMGDNRRESADSRYWGPLEKKRIVGRAYLRIFPLTLAGILPGGVSYAESDLYTNDEIITE